jgi:two-component system, OmpR family, sensor kinase
MAATLKAILAELQKAQQPAVGDELRSGFGVGLWVVGQLVDAMGGTIRVDDAQGGGSVFTVNLPRHVDVVRP